jgi:beta-mannosidase
MEGMVRRLRNHPALLMWCGGNENPMGFDFEVGGKQPIGRRLYEEVGAQVCARMDPDRPYHPNSPYHGPTPNWPLAGDWHDYSFRFFIHKSAAPTFGSEIGRASTPAYNSMRRFLTPEELWPKGFVSRVNAPGEIPWPPMWKYRSAQDTLESVGPAEDYPDPQDARDLVRVVGTAHGEYLQRRIERERRGVPDGAPVTSPANARRSGGHLICRYNDPWPVIHWGIVDYYLEPKIAYYFVRRAFAPVLLSFERSQDEMFVWVINDSLQPVCGQLSVQKVNFDGAVKGELCADVNVAPGEAVRCLDTLPFGRIYLRHEFLLARLGDLRATHCVAAERHLELPAARVTMAAEAGRLYLHTDVFARQVQLEADGVCGAAFEDNNFDMAPGEARDIAIVESAGAASITMRCVNAPAVTVTV